MARYCKNVEHDFYKLKLSLVDYIFSLQDKCDEKVSIFINNNYELHMFNKLIIDSLKLICYDSPPFPKFINYIELKMDYFEKITEKYEKDLLFSNHPLIDICFRVHFMVRVFSHYNTKFDLFCIHRRKCLQDYAKEGAINIKSVTEEDLVCYKFLVHFTKVVQIYGQKIFKFYFKVSPKSIYLSEETKKRYFKYEADRESSDSKLLSLINHAEYFEMEMEDNWNKFKGNLFLFKLFCQTSTFLYMEVLLIMISFIINLLILLDYTVPPSEDSERSLYDGEYYSAILSLAILEIILSFLSLIIWLVIRYSSAVRIISEKYRDLINSKELSVYRRGKIYFYTGFLKQNYVNSYFMHIIFMILALTTSTSFFGFDLLTIIFLSQTLQYVIQAVTEHFGQLIWTLGLGYLFMYIYALFCFEYFFGNFTGDKQFCNSLSHCFTQIVSIGFTNGQGIGDMMENEEYTIENWKKFYGRLVLVISFFIIVNTVLMNIIFGVIVDTFGELRDKMQAFCKNFFFFI